MPKYLIELDTEVVHDIPANTTRQAVEFFRDNFPELKERKITDVYTAINRSAWEDLEREHFTPKKIRKVK